jgi:hypothetical protein
MIRFNKSTSKNFVHKNNIQDSIGNVSKNVVINPNLKVFVEHLEDSNLKSEVTRYKVQYIVHENTLYFYPRKGPVVQEPNGSYSIVSSYALDHNFEDVLRFISKKLAILFRLHTVFKYDRNVSKPEDIIEAILKRESASDQITYSIFAICSFIFSYLLSVKFIKEALSDISTLLLRGDSSLVNNYIHYILTGNTSNLNNVPYSLYILRAALLENFEEDSNFVQTFETKLQNRVPSFSNLRSYFDTVKSATNVREFIIKLMDFFSRAFTKFEVTAPRDYVEKIKSKEDVGRKLESHALGFLLSHFSDDVLKSYSIDYYYKLARIASLANVNLIELFFSSIRKIFDFYKENENLIDMFIIKSIPNTNFANVPKFNIYSPEKALQTYLKSLNLNSKSKVTSNYKISINNNVLEIYDNYGTILYKKINLDEMISLSFIEKLQRFILKYTRFSNEFLKEQITLSPKTKVQKVSEYMVKFSDLIMDCFSAMSLNITTFLSVSIDLNYELYKKHMSNKNLFIGSFKPSEYRLSYTNLASIAKENHISKSPLALKLYYYLYYLLLYNILGNPELIKVMKNPKIFEKISQSESSEGSDTNASTIGGTSKGDDKLKLERSTIIDIDFLKSLQDKSEDELIRLLEEDE